MIPLFPLIGIGAVVLLVVLQSQHRKLTGGASSPAQARNVPARAVLNEPQQAVLGGSVIDMAGEQGLSVGTQLATNAAKNVGSSLATAIPIIGGVVSAIAGSLLAAHEQRKAQATSENDAVDRFIPAWDQALTQIVNNYNSGALTATQAITLLDSLWPQYWAEVTPHIQPQRNGCNGGAGID